MSAPPNDMKLDSDAMIRVVVAAINEAFTHADGEMGFILVIGRPNTTEGVRFAANIESQGAIDTLEGVIELLKLKAFEPVAGGKPN